MSTMAPYSDARGRRLKWITVVALVILAGFAGVFAWQRWPPDERPSVAETARRGEEKPVVAAPAPTKRVPKPLDTFKDCAGCPEMVVIPAGSFMMGSPATEPERAEDEGPQHRVTIGPFAIGKTEMTFAQGDACVTAGGCNGYKPPDKGWGRGDARPVVSVSWKDAKAYVSWLSQHTGQPYRKRCSGPTLPAAAGLG